MRRVHVQGVARLPAVAADPPDWCAHRSLQEASWSVQGASGPRLVRPEELDEAEVVETVTAQALADAGLSRRDVGFICSGSCDYYQGRPFSFVMALDGAGCWPPQRESHVEMDAAWALYEAFVRLQHGDIDVALVYGFGRSSVGSVDDVLTQQLDPYFVQPLGPSPMVLAALQAQRLMQAGELSERDLAEEVARRFGAARRNRHAAAWGGPGADELLEAPMVASPLREHDGPVWADGAAAVVLVAEGSGPLITGIAHEIEPMDLGRRDLLGSASAAGAARRAKDMAARNGVGGKQIDVFRTHASFSHQSHLLKRALDPNCVGLDEDGGSMVGDVPMVAGLSRIIAATEAVRGGALRAMAHAAQGPLMQQSLVTILAEPGVVP